MLYEVITMSGLTTSLRDDLSFDGGTWWYGFLKLQKSRSSLLMIFVIHHQGLKTEKGFIAEALSVLVLPILRSWRSGILRCFLFWPVDRVRIPWPLPSSYRLGIYAESRFCSVV